MAMQILQPVTHFAPSEVAAKLAVSIGIGLLVGIERSGPTRTSARERLCGPLCSVRLPRSTFPRWRCRVSSVLLIVVFANARSLYRLFADWAAEVCFVMEVGARNSF